ncbi:MAG: periplasmic protein [Bacteroidetes bacterium]|nr:MAG: periplasmic protein [Bacteroidota bacterium]
MENKHEHKLYNPSGCLSEAGLSLFVQGLLSEGQVAEVKNHLQTCEFCALAVEGISFSDPESFSDDVEIINASFLHLHDNIPTPEQEPALSEADGFEGPRFPRLSQEEISKFRNTILDMESGKTKDSPADVPIRKLSFFKRYRLELIAAVLLILLGIGGRHLYFEISGSREADELASAPEVEMKMMEIQPGLPSTDDESTEPAVTVKPPAAVSDIRIVNDDIEIESDQVMEKNEVSDGKETLQERMPPLFPEDLKPKENKSMGYAVVEEDKKVTEVVTYIDGIAVGAEKKSTRRSNKQQSMADEEEVAETEIFAVVETSPSFPGGDEARIRFLTNNISYPQEARDAGISGTVYITFVVERDGSTSDIRVLRGIGGGCDEEAVRVIKMMPEWSPGKQRGKPVRVQFNMPIKFSLAE